MAMHKNTRSKRASSAQIKILPGKRSAKTALAVIALGLLAALFFGLSSGCAGAPKIPPRPLPVGARISADYNYQGCFAALNIEGVRVGELSLWYPGRPESFYTIPPFHVKPRSEIVRFNFTFQRFEETSRLDWPWVLVSKHTQEENPNLLGPGIGFSRDHENFIVDLRPLIESGCTKKPSRPGSPKLKAQ